MIYWFTGQPGHGKTTLAKALIAHLRTQGVEPFHVDGDDLRALTANADYSRAGREANIRRALTLVPDEARGFFDVVAAQYLAGPQMRDFSREFRAITHLQIELLAARVSALNQCTY